MLEVYFSEHGSMFYVSPTIGPYVGNVYFASIDGQGNTPPYQHPYQVGSVLIPMWGRNSGQIAHGANIQIRGLKPENRKFSFIDDDWSQGVVRNVMWFKVPGILSKLTQREKKRLKRDKHVDHKNVEGKIFELQHDWTLTTTRSPNNFHYQDVKFESLSLGRVGYGWPNWPTEGPWYSASPRLLYDSLDTPLGLSQPETGAISSIWENYVGYNPAYRVAPGYHSGTILEEHDFLSFCFCSYKVESNVLNSLGLDYITANSEVDRLWVRDIVFDEYGQPYGWYKTQQLIYEAPWVERKSGKEPKLEVKYTNQTEWVFGFLPHTWKPPISGTLSRAPDPREFVRTSLSIPLPVMLGTVELEVKALDDLSSHELELLESGVEGVAQIWELILFYLKIMKNPKGLLDAKLFRKALEFRLSSLLEKRKKKTSLQDHLDHIAYMRKHGLTAITDVMKQGSGHYLAWVFGIRPLMKDINDIKARLEEAVVTGEQRINSSREFETWIDGRKYDVKESVLLYVKPHVGQLHEFLRKVSSTGLLPDFGQVWNLVTMSFLVNWFINVGAMLDVIDHYMINSRLWDLVYRSSAIKYSREELPEGFTGFCRFTGYSRRISRHWSMSDTVMAEWEQGGSAPIALALLIQRESDTFHALGAKAVLDDKRMPRKWMRKWLNQSLYRNKKSGKYFFRELNKGR